MSYGDFKYQYTQTIDAQPIYDVLGNVIMFRQGRKTRKYVIEYININGVEIELTEVIEDEN